MKYLLVLILIFMSSLSFASDNTPILSSDMAITMPDLIYNGSNLNYTIVLKYNGNTWYLYSATPNKPLPTPSPTPTPTPSPTPQPVDDYGSNTASILSEINLYRSKGAPCASGGLSPLSYDSSLSLASLNHSIDMAVNNYFSHTGLNGSTFSQRAYEAGFTGQPLGENIGAGYSVNSVVTGWINSQGHCLNIMSPSATLMGYGWASYSDSDWGMYHTMITGRK